MRDRNLSLSLIVVGKKLTGDDFGAAEIKDVPATDFRPSCGMPPSSTGSIRPPESATCDCARQTARRQVEIDVISHIHRARFINCGAIVMEIRLSSVRRYCTVAPRLPGSPDHHHLNSGQTAPDDRSVHNLPATFVEPFRPAVQLVNP